MIQINVDLRVPAHLTDAALAAAPGAVRDEMRRTLFGSLLVLEGEIVRRTPVGVAGTLRAATQTSVHGDLRDLTGRVWNPTVYGPAVEDGGRPHWAPLEPIQRWAQRVIGGPKAMRTARAIWVSISKKGTKAQPFWDVSWQAKKPEILQRNEQMLTRITRLLGGAP